MSIFDLGKLQLLADEMPITYCLLSDVSRLLIADLLTRTDRWLWRYNGSELTDEQWDVAQGIIDNAMKEVLTGMLTGTVILWTCDSPPGGFLLCDGSEVLRSEYEDLFGVIGITFGPGDGETTFDLPNLLGRVAVGYDVGQAEFDAIGEQGGEKEHTLIPGEMPVHSHSEGYALPVVINGGLEAPAASAVPSTTSTGNTGGDQPHNNLQPYLTLNYIIKT